MHVLLLIILDYICSHLSTVRLQIFRRIQVDHLQILFLPNLVQLLLFIITPVRGLQVQFFFFFLFCFSCTLYSYKLTLLWFLTGNLQGLQNMHGSFNVPNMQGTLGSRNATINSVPSSNVQQASGNLSGGRFASNNLPVALSQVVSTSSLYNEAHKFLVVVLDL